MKDNQVRFRADEELRAIITKNKQLLGLPNESAALRILIKQGDRAINDLLNNAWNVTHPLKLSEIDYFTTALNINLKKRKKEESRAK